MKYRAEIDGLRAFAVVLVILFHAEFELFSGGFIGVDVFFVISGFLITTILIEDIEKKSFSIVKFYERRARRILPALFFVMLVCIPFAWTWMLPDALENFGQSLVATTIFSNNILLYLTSDYWDVASKFKPLLHTWSLGVEEQYYILFPIFLLVISRLGKSIVFWIIVMLALLSLLISEYVWRNDLGWVPFTGKFFFYMLPTRAWEILSGSIAAFITKKIGIKANNGLSLMGLVAIAFAIITYDQHTPFPSIYTLVPVIGVVFILLFGDKSTFVAKLLSMRPLVGIGLISYSAYLWHHPLFTLAKIRLQEAPSKTLLGFLIAASFSLAFFTWIFIEKPFRDPRVVNRKRFVFTTLGCSAVTIIFGLFAHITDGIPSRIYDSELAFQRSSHEFKNASTSIFLTKLIEKKSFDTDSAVKVFISGDSFSGDAALLIYNAYSENSLDILIRGDSQTGKAACDALKYQEIAPELKADIFIFAYDEGHDFECSMKLIRRLEQKGKIILLFGTKHFGDNLNWISSLNISERSSLCQPPSSKYMEIEIRDKNNFPEANYISLIDWTGLKGCIEITTPNGELISSDRKHLTIAGVEYLSEVGLKNSKLNTAINKILGK